MNNATQFLKKYSLLITLIFITLLIFDLFIVMPVGSDNQSRLKQIKSVDSKLSDVKKINTLHNLKLKVLKMNSRDIVNTIKDFSSMTHETSFIHFIRDTIEGGNIFFTNMTVKRTLNRRLRAAVTSIEFDFSGKMSDLRKCLSEIRSSEYYTVTDRLKLIYKTKEEVTGKIHLMLYMLEQE
jgi:hypothetical protein